MPWPGVVRAASQTGAVNKMGVIVQSFDYSKFVTRYPELASLSEDLLKVYWTEAQIYHRNDGGGPVEHLGTQELLLFMVTAHIALRNAVINGQVPSSLVGRLNSASEGSVSVSVDLTALPGSAAFFTQTKYGFDYWQATASYRTMRYMPSPGRFGPFYPFGRRSW